MKHGDHALSRAGCHRVIDDLRFASRLNQTRAAQHCQMLRQDRLAHRNLVVQLTDRLFAANQTAQDAKAMFVGHDSKQASCCFGLFGELDGQRLKVTFGHVRKYTAVAERLSPDLHTSIYRDFLIHVQTRGRIA